jgi:hypothetical protein
VLILLIEPDARSQAFIAVITVGCSVAGAKAAAWLAGRP